MLDPVRCILYAALRCRHLPPAFPLAHGLDGLVRVCQFAKAFGPGIQISCHRNLLLRTLFRRFFDFPQICVRQDDLCGFEVLPSR